MTQICACFSLRVYSAEMSAKRSGMGRCYEKGGVGMGSAPLPTQGSVGSYSSLSNSFRVKSLPGSVMAMNWSRMSSYEKEEPSGSQVHLRHIENNFLTVKQ